MKVSLYSVSYSGIWYKGNPLSIEELMDKAVELGFDGIEIDGKRPHGFPLDLDDNNRKKIRKMADSRGLEICAVAGNNNFVSPIDEQRENELLMLSEQLRLARERYEMGSGSFLELVEAETVMASSEHALVEAIYSFHQAVVDLETLVGQPLREAGEVR